MAKYEIEAEYDDPKEIPFRNNCIYCLAPGNVRIKIEEQSKISNILSQSVLPVFILFLVYCLILDSFIKNRSLTAPAILLSTITWSFIRIFAKRYFKGVFRYAEPYACPNCFEKLRRMQTIDSIYLGTLFAGFLILVILSFAYNSDELKYSSFAAGVFAVCIFGVLLQPWILGLIRKALKLQMKAPFTLRKQGFLQGLSRLTMPEEAFVKLIDETVESDANRQ